MPADERYVIVMVTVPTEELGATIAWQLVSDKLAACVNMFKTHSTYAWAGEIRREHEEILLIKTTLGLFERLKAKVIEMHTYEVPEIIALPIIAGHTPYLNWITDSVAREG